MKGIYNFAKENFIAFLGIGVLIIGLFIASFLVGERQETRKRALPGGPSLYFNPAQIDIDLNNIISGGTTYDIYMNTNGFDVTAAVIEVSYVPTDITITSIDPGAPLPVNLGTEITGTTAKITIGAQPTNPFNGEAMVASITFDVAATSPVTSAVSFTSNTQVAAIGYTGDVLGTTMDGSVNIFDLTAPTSTPTTAPTATPTTGPSSEGEIFINPNLTTKSPGDIWTSTLRFRTGGNPGAQAISGISIRLTYPYSGVTPELDVVDGAGSPTNSITPDPVLVASQDWAFSVNSVSRQNNIVMIDFAAVNTSITGFTSSSLVELATINFKANSIPSGGQVVVAFDMTETKMMTKLNPTNILKTPGSAFYTIEESTGTLVFSFAMQGVGSAGVNKTVDLTFEEVGGAGVYNFPGVVVVSNSAGVFGPTAPLPLTGIPLAGTQYSVYAKDDGYLRKKLGDISLNAGDNFAPSSWGSQMLLAGDFDDNNILNVFDIGDILSVYIRLSVVVIPSNQVFDINVDDIISLEDIVIVLSNYTSLNVPGE
jgi:hypothetical protein